jgi:hydrogenase expression/formation protein HypC
MCLAIPSKIVSIKEDEIIVNELGKKRKIKGSLIKGLKTGDYVLLQNSFITSKITKSSAEETLALLKKEITI